MNKITGRILSACVMAVWWLWVGAKGVLDLIGYSTVPDDVDVAQTRLDQLIGWFFSVPWWVLLPLAFASTIWLIWVSWPRQPKPISAAPDAHPSRVIESAAPVNHSVSIDAVNVTTQAEEETATALMMFFLDYIQPAVRAQRQLQVAMVRSLHGSDVLLDLAVGGITSRNPSIELFWRSFERLRDAFSSSPPELLSSAGMIPDIAIMEVHYRHFCDQADTIAQKAGIAYRKEHTTEWEKWRTAHNALTEEYDREIKRSPRFGELFRPARSSRWGNIIPPLSEPSGTP